MSIYVSLRLEAEATFSIVFENIAPRTVISISIAPSLGAIYNLNRKTFCSLKILFTMRNLQLTQTRKYDMIPVKNFKFNGGFIK